MSNEIAIQVQSVSKTFRVHNERRATLKERLLFAGRGKFRDFLVLDDVSFNVPKGSTVGLIGTNGSGKSTLLKLISRILYPDQGSIVVNGRVSSLLELGAGFHPDFTGIENIYLNAALLGLSKAEVTKKLSQIITFSELGDFINEPMRSYSSGMQMRLAFSVAIAVDPDILLLDEIIAVGDAAFQAKCLAEIRRLQREGKTIVLVSHDAGVVERFCDTVVWLHNSRLRMAGSAPECMPEYLSAVFKDSRQGNSVMSFNRTEEVALATQETKDTVEPILQERSVLQEISVMSERGEGIAEIGRPVKFIIGVKTVDMLVDVAFGIGINADDGRVVWGTNTFMDKTGTYVIDSGKSFTVVLNVPSMPLLPGTYTVDISAHDSSGALFDLWDRATTLTIVGEQTAVGVVGVDHHWNTPENFKLWENGNGA